MNTVRWYILFATSIVAVSVLLFGFTVDAVMVTIVIGLYCFAVMIGNSIGTSYEPVTRLLKEKEQEEILPPFVIRNGEFYFVVSVVVVNPDLYSFFLDEEGWTRRIRTLPPYSGDAKTVADRLESELNELVRSYNGVAKKKATVTIGVIPVDEERIVRQLTTQA